MLRQVRRGVLSGLRRAGLLDRAANSAWRQNRLAILCYHGISISDEHDWNSQLYVPADFLRKRFDVLKRGGYNVVPLEDGLRRLNAGTLLPRSVAITFDDGAHDFYDRAFPLLIDYGFPATVYITSYYCSYQRPVPDTGYSYVLWKSRRREIDLSGIVPDGGRVSLATAEDRRNVGLALRAWANDSGLSAGQKDELLRRIAERVGLDYESVFSERQLYIMSPGEVREVTRHGIDVQLHTHRHRTPDDELLFLREIADNRNAIQSIAGGGVRRHFCYPSGVYRNPFVGWLRKAEMSSATTCDFGLASRSDDPLLLPRIVDTMRLTEIEFEAWLSGVAQWLPHRRNFSQIEELPVEAHTTDAAA